MTMDEGTPKRRRGLFRRDRPDEPAATEPRPSSSDGFDDPWSASAWDDWDDDFTAGGQRSSVPAAAAPRPEAVDAWLQSEANDFDDAARKNTKRWGGDANRAATGANADGPAGADGSVGAGGFGLAARLRTFDQSPASTFSTDAVPAATPRAAASAASSISPAVEPRPVIDTSAEMWMEQPSTPSSIAAPIAAPTEPAHIAAHIEAPTEPAHIAAPTEPSHVDQAPQTAHVDPMRRLAHGTMEDDEDDLVDDLSMVDDEDAVAPAAPQRTTGDHQTRLPDIAEQLFAFTDDDQLSATAPLAPPTPLATLDSGAPTAELDRATAFEDDELQEIDRLGPDPEDDADLRMLDEEPTSAAPPAASWAPPGQVLPTPVSAIPLAPTDAPTPPASSVPQPRHQPPQRQQPEPQPQPHQQDQPNEIAAAFSPGDTIAGGSASRFVSVSVSTDDDRAAAVLPAAETGTPPFRPERFAPAEFIQSEPAEVAPPTPGLTTSATGSPRSTSRWAQLSAEFDSDGDLDDSFPRPPSAPPGRRPTALTDAAMTPATPATPATPFTDMAAPTTPITETRTQTQPIEQPASIDQPRPTAEAVIAEHATAETAIADSDEDPWRRPSPRTPRPVSPPTEARSLPTSATSAASPTAADTDDPWARPPVSRTNTPAESSRPPRRPDPAAAPPYLGEQTPDATDTPARKPRRTRNVESPGIVETSRAPEAHQSVDVAQGEDATARPTLLHPDLSTFAGVIGSALVAFAAVRLVLTLVGTQPAVPAQFTGTKADFLRIGESFAKSGTAWPVALVVGTVLLVLPGYLGLRGHLRRWAPILGMALATGLGAIIVGYLRISSGLQLKTASTLKLVSDAIVGPIGFGLITVLSVAFAVRAAQANPPH